MAAFFSSPAATADVIFWPGSVTYWIDKGPQIDPSKIEIQLPPVPFPLGPPKIE